MNAGRDVERLIADWFVEEAVLRAPDRVLEETGRAIDQLQRRPLRLPWRTPTMTRFALLGATVALVAAVGVAGLALTSRSPAPDVGAPSPSPSQSPTESSSASQPAAEPSLSPFVSTLTDMFISSQYGYSMQMDPSWTVARATVAADSPAATDDNASDRIAVTGTDTTIGITANELNGTSFDDWLTDVHAAVLEDPSVPGSCKNGDPGGWPDQPVGNRIGRLMTLCNFAQVFVEVYGKAYTFTWGNDTFDEASHLDVLDFKRALETVTFAASGPPPNLSSPAPVFPTTTLPDPVGEPLPADLIGRTYGVNPPEIQGTQESILSLRAADDPHCAALYPDGSTCFTILWTPNWPKHVTDPAARGAARIAEGNLVLRFDWVPFGKECEGKLSTYAVEDGGATLSGIDTECGYPAFAAH